MSEDGLKAKLAAAESELVALRTERDSLLRERGELRKALEESQNWYEITRSALSLQDAENPA
jgi:hypothetical protein